MEQNNKNQIIQYCFMIDSTGSMRDSLVAAHEQIINIANDMKNTIKKEFSSVNSEIEFAIICYRDPIDCEEDEHEFYDFTSDVLNIKEFISRQEAKGGGDTPEDWVGGFDILFNKLSWKENVKKCLTLIADAPPHGTKFCINDKYKNEDDKLIEYIKQLAKEQFVIKLIGVNHDVIDSMKLFKNYFIENNGISCDIDNILLTQIKYNERSSSIGTVMRACSTSIARTVSKR